MTMRYNQWLPILAIPLLFQPLLANAESCTDTLREIESYYNKTVDNCGSHPASDCSGLLIRGTHRAPNGEYDVWNTSPKADELGTTAVSYMRADDIGYADPGMHTSNGMIIMNRDKAQEKKLEALHVACAFPVDAYTDWRADRGCGDNSRTPQKEQLCQNAGINSAQSWLNNYRGVDFNHMAQCGFNMRNPMSDQDRTKAFSNFLAARRMVNKQEFQTQTELRLFNPAKDKMPVWAFFYSDERGRADALANQIDYQRKTGRSAPVVKINFASYPGGKATFSCDSTQAPPPAKPRCDKYIESSKWIKRYDPGYKKDIWSLQVIPTRCGRKIQADETDLMFAELYNKHNEDPQWREYTINGGTMRRQMVCHLTSVHKSDQGTVPMRDKPEWNLEPARPYVSHEEAAAAGCNPLP